MSQPAIPNSSENPPAPPPAPPAAPPPPAPAAPPPAAPAGSGGNPFNAEAAFRQLSDTLNALPEKLVNGVREAGQAAPPAPVVNPPAQEKAQKKGFADWWFNK